MKNERFYAILTLIAVFGLLGVALAAGKATGDHELRKLEILTRNCGGK